MDVATTPGAARHTSTWALTNGTLPYMTALGQAIGDDPAMAKAHRVPHVPLAPL